MTRIKRHLALSVAFTAVVLGQAVPSSAADDAKKTATENHANVHVRSLLKKRLDVLRQIAKLRRAAYRNGEAGINALIRAELDVLQAQLELAAKPDERVAIRKTIVKQAAALEAAAKKRFEAKQATAIDVLRAKAFRLRCEADLLRERSAAHQHHHGRHTELSYEAFVRAQTVFLRTLGELDVVRREIARLKAVAGRGVAGKPLLDRQSARDKLLAALHAQEEALYLHGLSKRQIESIREKRKLIRQYDHGTAPNGEKPGGGAEPHAGHHHH